jgi:hypothetical protein
MSSGNTAVSIRNGKGDGEGGKDGLVEEPPFMERMANRMNGNLMGAYFRLGYSIGSRPRSWIAGALVLCLLLTIGNFAPGPKNENRGEKLWVPAGTQAQDDKVFVDSLYGSTARFGDVIVKVPGGGDALEPKIFALLATLVARIEATSIMWDGKNITWEEQCYRIGPSCTISHPLKAFANPADYDTKAKILATMNTKPAPLDLVTSRDIYLDSVVGGITKAGSRVESPSGGLPPRASAPQAILERPAPPQNASCTAHSLLDMPTYEPRNVKSARQLCPVATVVARHFWFFLF